MAQARVLRVYPAYIDGSPSEVMPIDKQFLEVWAALGCSRTAAINKVFIAGLEAMGQSKALEGKVDQRAWAIHRKWQETMVMETQWSQLEYIYSKLGLDKFREWCDQNGIDHATFLDDYEMRVPDSTSSRSEAIGQWLDRLLASGEEYKVEDIREAAELDGIVRNGHADDDWSLLKYVASKKGYSGGRRGYWKVS